MALLNWTPDKGDSFELPKDLFEFEKAQWKIIPEDEAKGVKSYFREERKIIENIRVNLHCYVWTFLLIDDPTVTRMISDVKGQTELEYVDDILTTYMDYPMAKMIEVKIPMVSWKNMGWKEQWKGHMMWQISKIYEEIYRNYWEEVQVYGHDIEDLAFGNLIIHENKIVNLYLESPGIPMLSQDQIITKKRPKGLPQKSLNLRIHHPEIPNIIDTSSGTG